MKASANRERRKYIRHPVQIPIVCRRKEHLEPHQAELHDIGCGGMAFVSTVAFEPGDVISVDYPTLDVRGLAGEITWSEMLDDGTGEPTRRHSAATAPDDKGWTRRPCSHAAASACPL